MSNLNEIDIRCPRCDEDFRGTVWVAIHASSDPELKELLMGGELNMVQCTHCGYIFFYEHFLLYQDPEEEIVAYVYRESEQGEEPLLRETMNKGFREAQKILPENKRFNFEPTLFFGLESLIELLEAETSRKEEAEVAEALCREHHLTFVRIAPARARVLNLPRIIPYVGLEGKKNPSKQEIGEGIQKLLEVSPTFESYATLLNTIQSDSAWRPDGIF